MRSTCSRPRHRAVAVVLLAAVAVVGTARPAHADAVDSADDASWLRPVSGPALRPFEEPASIYGAGHRGADLAAGPGTPVRAANDGVVSFAGTVAHTLHVTVTHAGGLRTSYSFLSSVSVRTGQEVSRGDVLGATGGTGPDHDGSVLHLGLRVGDRYVDPMQLFRPSDLTKLVHLVPADAPAESPWSPARERRDLRSSLRLPVPGAGGASPSTSSDGCDTDLPLIGGVVDAACDVGTWLGDHADDALDAGIDFLDASTDLAGDALDQLRTSAQHAVGTMQSLAATAAGALAHTPAGQVALDLVAIGRRFAHTLSVDCSDAPAADGTGGSTHRLMVVAGINSSGEAWDRGPTVDLDVDALGYHAGEGEIRYFSYAGDGGAYTKDDTHRPIVESAALLAAQLRKMQREQPGREVDLIAHSQGGVVVDVFLASFYRAGDRSYPPLGNVVTLSSPHEGAPLATVGQQVRATRPGKVALDMLDDVAPIPPTGSPAVQDLAERSSVIREVQANGVPEHFDYTTIGATEDLVVPATNISLPGATETVAAVDGVNEHSAIVQAPDALKAVRAALEGRPPPCVGLLTALRTAVSPVLISRFEHAVGDDAGFVLRGGLRNAP
jgi:murein DD-endopeptidase MepM/ murein hydrolase activator NlpD